MTGGVEVVSFGCRLNLVEGEAVRRAALAAGRENLTVVNSCGVTAEAARQARQAVRRARRDHPARTVVVTGCAPAMEPERFAALAPVVPNGRKTVIETWAIGDGGRVAGPDGAPAYPEPGSPLAEGVDDHTRAFLAVQNGCDHSCTFCAIPQGRGRARSAPLAEAVAAARRMAARGFREVVLTGVDLTSWGDDLPGRPRLGALVRAVLHEVPELPRLRLSSLDCVEADADLVRAFAEEERLMPSLHLSLQHGDDLILKRMKRRHGRAAAIDFCATLRRLRPDIAFGADLIAGFPTETDAQAAATRSLVEDCGLVFLHVFPYSARPGTPAARMPPVAPAAVKERAAQLREDGARALRRHFRAQVGRRVAVLAERGGRGRAPDSTPVATTAPPGTIAHLTIAGHDGRQLHGRPFPYPPHQPRSHAR